MNDDTLIDAINTSQVNFKPSINLDSLASVVIDTKSQKHQLYMQLGKVLDKLGSKRSNLICTVLCLHDFGGLSCVKGFNDGKTFKTSIIDKFKLRNGIVEIVPISHEDGLSVPSSGQLVANSNDHESFFIILFSICCNR